jgi:transposase
MIGLLDWTPRELIVRTSRSKRSADFIALLDQIDTQYGPTRDRAKKPIVLVLDSGPIHTRRATRAALAERAPWLTVEWLPKFMPELNDIEELGRDLKQHHLAHQTFAGPDNLNDAIHEAVMMLNCERNRQPLANHRIAA